MKVLINYTTSFVCGLAERSRATERPNDQDHESISPAHACRKDAGRSQRGILTGGKFERSHLGWLCMLKLEMDRLNVVAMTSLSCLNPVMSAPNKPGVPFPTAYCVPSNRAALLGCRHDDKHAISES